MDTKAELDAIMERPFEIAAGWATRNGIDPKKFNDTMKSFTVKSRTGRALVRATWQDAAQTEHAEHWVQMTQ